MSDRAIFGACVTAIIIAFIFSFAMTSSATSIKDGMVSMHFVAATSIKDGIVASGKSLEVAATSIKDGMASAGVSHKVFFNAQTAEFRSNDFTWVSEQVGFLWNRVWNFLGSAVKSVAVLIKK